MNERQSREKIGQKRVENEQLSGPSVDRYLAENSNDR